MTKEEDFKRNNAFSLYDLHVYDPCPWGHEIYYLGRNMVNTNLASRRFSQFIDKCQTFEIFFQCILLIFTFVNKIYFVAVPAMIMGIDISDYQERDKRFNKVETL